MYFGNIDQLIKGNENLTDHIIKPNDTTCMSYFKDDKSITETVLANPLKHYDDEKSSCILDSSSTARDLIRHSQAFGNTENNNDSEDEDITYIIRHPIIYKDEMTEEELEAYYKEHNQTSTEDVQNYGQYKIQHTKYHRNR